MRESKSERLRQWRRTNPEKWKAANRRNAKCQRAKYKFLVFAYYGRACECCGVNYQEFLTIDHILGGGNKHRKQIGLKCGSAFYQWLVVHNFPEDYRTLCWNCNASRGMYGFCPHRAIQDARTPR